MASPEQPRDDRFLRLYTEHEPSLRGFVRSLVPTREDVREVMQEVAVALWRKSHRDRQALTRFYLPAFPPLPCLRATALQD